MEAREGSLWRHRRFNVFWAGQTLSAIGDSFTAVAFPLLVYETTGKLEKMAAVTGCIAGGALVSGLFAGPIVDRSNRWQLMLLMDLLRGLLMATIPAAAALHVLSFPLLMVIASAMGYLANLSGVTYVAFLPELVTKAHVSEGNSRLTTTGAATYVVGPALAGLAAQKWGPHQAIGVDSLSFFASFVFLLFVKPAAGPPRERSNRSLSAGLKFLLATPLVRTMSLVVCAEALLTAAALDLFTFHLKSTLHENDTKVGTMFAVAAVGSVVGAALSSYAKRRPGIHASYVISAGLLAVAFAVLPSASSFALTAAVAVTFSFSSTVRDLLSMSRRQEVTPDGLIGRVTAIIFLAIGAMQVLGAAVVGLASPRFGYALTCHVLGAALFLLMLVTIRARSLRDSN